MIARDLGDYSKSYLSQIGSIKPELLTILYKCPGRKKKEERRKKKEEEEEEEEEEEDLEFALIDRRVAPVKRFQNTTEDRLFESTLMFYFRQF